MVCTRRRVETGSGTKHGALLPILCVSFCLVATVLPQNVCASVRWVVFTKVAGFLVEKLADYAVGKAVDAIDRQIGERYKTELQQRRDELHPTATTSEPVRLELRAIENQLKILETMLRSTPTQEQLNTFKAQLGNDLQLAKTVQEHSSRIEELERVVNALREEINRPKLPAMLKAPSPLPAKPSFNCNKARTYVEITICTNPTLASVDGRLGEVYWAARNALPSQQSQQLRLEQIAWIRERDYLLSQVCITEGKIDIHCAIGFWNLRIAQLESLLR